MNKNFEIKIKLLSVKHLNNIYKLSGKFEKSIEKQTDIYYRVSKGRLKLRIINDTTGSLILYYRSDKKSKRISNYTISKTEDFKELNSILTKQFGVLVKVMKKREVYTDGNVRIHIDKVKELGKFLEIEIIYKDIKKAALKMNEFIKDFGLDESRFIKNSYSDLLLNKKSKEEK